MLLCGPACSLKGEMEVTMASRLARLSERNCPSRHTRQQLSLPKPPTKIRALLRPSYYRTLSLEWNRHPKVPRRNQMKLATLSQKGPPCRCCTQASPKGDTRGSPSMLRCRQFFCHRTAKQPNDSCHMLDAWVSTGGHCPSQIMSRLVPAIRKLL
jgi:hypothetical protein